MPAPACEMKIKPRFMLELNFNDAMECISERIVSALIANLIQRALTSNIYRGMYRMHCNTAFFQVEYLGYLLFCRRVSSHSY